jgi:DNA primase
VGTVSERIKASVTVLEFVSQYVDLKPTASGAIGLCPFHDDHHPSFGVNAEGDYWNCWAGCGGGSVIDFWMRWRKCDFTTAVKELAEMLL